MSTHARLALTAVATLAAATTFSGLGTPAQATPSHRSHTGAVYVLSNQVAGNAVIAYDRGDDGTLTAGGRIPDRRTRHRRWPRLPGRGSSIDAAATCTPSMPARTRSRSFAVTRTGSVVSRPSHQEVTCPISVSVRGQPALRAQHRR